ncbi:MAG TPA: hypothetical protein VH595_16610 [Verrucomicrobiae bacterium]|nr:hypothetical protein [Verrucomicrobiae bacterium]
MVSAGDAREASAVVAPEQTIKEFIPASWFHPVGIYKVLARIWDRLPDVSGKLFLTFTLDPKLYANEETAFEDSRDWLRKVFFQLRHGVEHEGKTHTIDAPYCVKVEFHESGWVHYHVIFLTRRFLPKELLAELWGLGWVKVQRITNADFHYLLKYVTKPDELPEWLKKRKRLRVFQSTKGFLKPLNRPAYRSETGTESTETKEPRASYTIGERFRRWARMGAIRLNGTVRTFLFRIPYRKIFDHLVLSAALDGRYKGSGEIIIPRKEGISLWLTMQNNLLTTTSCTACSFAAWSCRAPPRRTSAKTGQACS